MGERVHRAGAERRLVQPGHRVRLREHQLRAHAVRRRVAVGQLVDRGHLGAGECRRQRRDAAAAHRGDGLGGVDHPAASKRHERGRIDLVQQRRRELVHGAVRHLVDRGRMSRELERRVVQGPLRGQQLVAVPAVPPERLDDVRLRVLLEDDRALGVAPGELLAAPRARGGTRTRSLRITNALLHQLSYPGAMFRIGAGTASAPGSPGRSVRGRICVRMPRGAPRARRGAWRPCA